MYVDPGRPKADPWPPSCRVLFCYIQTPQKSQVAGVKETVYRQKLNEIFPKAADQDACWGLSGGRCATGARKQAFAGPVSSMTCGESPC